MTEGRKERGRSQGHAQVWVFCDGSTGVLVGLPVVGSGGQGASLRLSGKAQGAEDRGQKSEGREQKAEDSDQKAEDGRQGAPLRLSGREQGMTRAVCAAGAVALTREGEILELAWQTLAPVTNTQAEYAGLLLGLGLAQQLQARETICVLDSEVVVGQMEGRYAVHSRGLRAWHWKACEAVRRLPLVRFRLAPREWNRLADGLAAQASLPWRELRGALER